MSERKSLGVPPPRTVFYSLKGRGQDALAAVRASNGPSLWLVAPLPSLTRQPTDRLTDYAASAQAKVHMPSKQGERLGGLTMVGDPRRRVPGLHQQTSTAYYAKLIAVGVMHLARRSERLP